MNYPEYNTLNPNHAREIYIRVNYPDFYAYLLSNYPKELSFGERLYWFYNKLNERPVCKQCGKPVRFFNIIKGYAEYCSCKCSNSSKEKREKTIQTNIERYGCAVTTSSELVKQKSKQTKLERYGNATFNNRTKAHNTLQERYGGIGNASKSIQQKHRDTMFERYGVENPMLIDAVKQSMREHNQEKYGVDWVFQRPDIQQKCIKTCLDKYVNEKEKQNAQKFNRNPIKYHMQIQGVKEKVYQTKKKNGTFNTSSIEEQFETYLQRQHIVHERQYKSEKYPYRCDFYFPEHDLYVEVQGSWTHGGHPYNSDCPEDVQKIKEWKSKHTDFYNNAIETWTQRDVQKRKTAYKNHLKYLEVFTNNIEELIYEYTRIIERF